MANCERSPSCGSLYRTLTHLFLASLAFFFSAFTAASVQQPSTIMPNASKSLLLDITKAGQRLVAVGDFGHILYSDDLGKNWQQAKVPTRQLLTAVSFVNAKKGWAVGHDGLILQTTDGGESWVIQYNGLEKQQQVNLSVAASMQDHLKGLKDQLALLAKDDSDSRAALEEQIEEAGYDLEDAEAALKDPVNTPPLMDVLFTSIKDGWVLGAFGQFFHTADGGVSWESYASRIDNPDDLHLNALAAGGAGEVFIAGEAGLAFFSTDGGENWQTSEIPYDGSLFGVVSSEDGAYQVCFGLRGNVFVSRDKGASWQALEVGTDFTLSGAFLAANGSITIVGSGGSVVHSNDIEQPFVSFQQENRLGLSGIVQVSEGRYVAVGLGGIYHLHLQK